MHEKNDAVAAGTGWFGDILECKALYFIAMPDKAIITSQCVSRQMNFCAKNMHKTNYGLMTSEYFQVPAFTVNSPVVRSISIWSTLKHQTADRSKTVPIT